MKLYLYCFVLCNFLYISCNGKMPVSSRQRINYFSDDTKNEDVELSCKEYVTCGSFSFASAAFIGIVSGRLCRKYDWLIPFPLNWMLWFYVRKTIVDSSSRLLSKCSIEHHHDSMQTIAWISDWLSYLYR